MRMYLHIIRVVMFLSGTTCYTGKLRRHTEYYSNLWTVQIFGGLEVAKKVALEVGFDFVEEIPTLPHLYHFRLSRHPKKGKYPNENLTQSLKQHVKVSWAEQESTERKSIRSITCPGEPPLGTVSRYRKAFTDNLYSNQWYIQDCRKSSNEIMRDINVIPVYYKYKIFGKGIIVIIVDDGVDTTHDDLKDNYDKNYGLDLIDNDDTPDPVSYFLKPFAHGTKCAGVVAMRAGNHLCGVGISPLVTLGAVRLLGPNPNTGTQDAHALSFKIEEVDILSNSWGPTDDAKTMTHIKPVVKAAIKAGIIKGRRGKGVIYVFACGNGKALSDTCGYDMYVNTIYTISVAGVDRRGKATSYSERCSGIMVSTYSGDIYSSDNLVTTDKGSNKCTQKHSGTSAATPVVAGAIALLLETNPSLTWREVQHVLAWTCEVAPLADNAGWHANKAGIYRNNDFGFGLLNVEKMIEFGKTMKPIPSMSSCVVPINLNHQKRTFSRTKGLQISVQTDGCEFLPSEVKYLEHVQLLVDITYPKRGAIKINLRAPSGTISHLLESRDRDTYTDGLRDWTLDTIHMWGESPQGEWIIYVFDMIGKHFFQGKVNALTLIFHGTKDKPPHYERPRTYYGIPNN